MDDFGSDIFDYPVHPESNPIDWPDPVEKKKTRPQLQEDIHEASKKKDEDDYDDDTMMFGLIACL